MATNDAIPLFLSDHTENPSSRLWEGVGHSGYFIRILKTSIFGYNGGSDRVRDSDWWKSTRAVYDARLPWSHIVASGWHRSVDANNSINRRRSGFAADCREAPTGDEIAAAFNSASQSQTENPQPPAEALFEQYQAWADEEDARTQVRPVQPVQDAQPQVQDDQTQVVQNAEHRSGPCKSTDT